MWMSEMRLDGNPGEESGHPRWAGGRVGVVDSVPSSCVLSFSIYSAAGNAS